MASQLIINGQELSASLTQKNNSRFSLFEDQFQKLQATSSTGKVIDLKSLKEPIIILNFWASWCLPCLAEFPSLNRLSETYPKKIKVIGINNDTEDVEKSVKKIQEKYSLNFESIIDTAGEFADKFKVMSLPATIVFHKGKVIKFITTEYDFMSSEFLSVVEKRAK